MRPVPDLAAFAAGSTPVAFAAVAAITFLAATPAGAAAPAYVGTWSMDAKACKIPQERQGAPMVIRRTGYDQHESHCAFKSLRRSGSAWWVSAQCTVEGSKMRDSFTMRVKGDTMVMARGQDKRTLKRCR